MTKKLLLLFGISLLFSQITQAEIFVQIGTGTAHSFDTTLTIEETGKSPFSFSADYDTHPLRPSPYYAVRIGKWNHKSGWEIELIHHKLYLNNLRPPIQSFRITNGYSFLLGNYAREYHGFILRGGAGALIAYPITTIDGVFTSGGYQLSGFAVQGSVEKKFFLLKNVFLSVEGKLTYAHPKIDINNGTLTVPNVAIHGVVSIGYEF